MRTIITGTIHQGDFKALNQIMRDFSSCIRFAFQRIKKDKIVDKDQLRNICKIKYNEKMNSRYIADAVLKAIITNRSIETKENKYKHPIKIIFGGKRNWKKLQTGSLKKEEWHQIRDSELYSRGEKSKSGNLNIRVLDTSEGYKLRVGLGKAREFIIFNLYIPDKFKEIFELNNDCYDIRIKYKDNRYYVMIGVEVPEVTPIYLCKNGTIGVDVNPDGLAVAEIDTSGNLLKHEYLECQRMQFSKHTKRKNDIEMLALQIVNRAILAGKGIVIEDLKFNDKKSSIKKFNRMRHNFLYAQILRAIERRALKDGVEVKKVNSAFTSISGILKYQEMYSLNRHTSAALIIARRGFGIIEKIRVKVDWLKNKKVNLAGAYRSQGKALEIALTNRSYSYFRDLYRVFEVNLPELTAPCFSP
jgi:IS605 OrfB family transposase